MSRWLRALVLVVLVAPLGCSSSAETAPPRTAGGQGSARQGGAAPAPTDAHPADDTSSPAVTGVWRKGSRVVVLLRLPEHDDGSVRIEGLAERVEGIRLVDLANRTVRLPVASGRRGRQVIAEFDVEPVLSEVRVLLERGDDLGPVAVESGRPADLRAADLPEAVPLPTTRVRSMMAVAEGAAGTFEIQHDDRREVALPADVLFDTDRSDLSERAGAVVSAAVEALRHLTPGSVVVVAGNTDDVGADGYNLDLSRRRAETVAAAIGAAQPAVAVVLRVEARGEAHPLVPNLDSAGKPIDANRSLNRRVSLEFASAVDARAESKAVDGVVVLPDALPAVDGVPVAGSAASASATVSNALGTSTFRLDVTAASRLDGALRVSFALQTTGGSNPKGDAWTRLFADAPRSDGTIDVDDSLLTGAQSLRSVRLLDGRLLVRPLLDDEGWVVGSRDLRGPLPVGSVVRLVAWFPPPAPDATTIDLMIPTFGTVRGFPLS